MQRTICTIMICLLFFMLHLFCVVFSFFNFRLDLFAWFVILLILFWLVQLCWSLSRWVEVSWSHQVGLQQTFLPFPEWAWGGWFGTWVITGADLWRNILKACWHVLHSMVLQFLVNAIPMIVFMLDIRLYRTTVLQGYIRTTNFRVNVHVFSWR